MSQQKAIDKLAKQIAACTKCPRLTVYTRGIAEKKVRRFMDWNYWGKPVPGFGDPNAKLLIIGLAPAAHGANRTGRMFTGDSSGDWLYRALYETGFANQPTSTAKDDGLQLTGAYITATARCAPPDNKPLPEEIENCSVYLEKEIELLSNVKVILCLGHIAFNQYCKLHNLKGLDFAHNKKHKLQNGITLVTSYHPSKQNTQTGRLKWEDWLLVFSEIRSLIS